MFIKIKIKGYEGQGRSTLRGMIFRFDVFHLVSAKLAHFILFSQFANYAYSIKFICIITKCLNIRFKKMKKKLIIK